MKSKRKIIAILLMLVGVVATALLSGTFNSYVMTLLNGTLLYFLCSAGISLIMGMGGLLSFCSITFMGLGSFVAAKSSLALGVPTSLALLMGILAAMIASYLLGLVLSRLKGVFFVFATIGLVNIGTTIYTNYRPLTGGADGTYGIPNLVLFGIEFQTMQQWFVLLLIVTVVVFVFINRVRKSSFGRSLMAVRDDEIAAKTLGIDVYRTKVRAFTITGTMAGIAGALLAFHNGVVSASLFTFDVQIKFVTMVMLGGVNSTWGALIGTFLVRLMPEMMRSFARYMMLVYGVSVVLLMIFMPDGLVGIGSRLRVKLLTAKIRKKGGKVDGSFES